MARVVVVSIIAAVGAGALLAIFAESWLLEIDEPLYFDWLGAGEDVRRYGPDSLNRLGQPLPAIALAIVVSLATLRCRVVSIAYPAVIVVGGLTNVVLSWITHRLRPPRSTHAGEFTSYPGGHSLQVPLLLLALPLAVYVMTDSKLARNVTGVSVTIVWAVTWVDTIRTGGHWPTDQVAGFLIAMALLIVVYSVAGDALRHESCDSCRLGSEISPTPLPPT
ncbi:MAG: phosphatase PAP2 family protein [Acidimicrobiales bacterium]